MVNAELSSLERSVSEHWDGNFLFINALRRLPGLKEISSSSVAFYKLQLIISRCIHIKHPVKSSITSNEILVDNGDEELERDTLLVPALNARLVFAFMSKASPLNQIITCRSVVPCINESRLYAVLIGIDAYRSYPLRGCVSDALAVRKYLTDDLHVPKERIECLLSPGDDCLVNSSIPSRENIISSLLGLVQNPHIQPGDGIIIYFAGHGTSYQCTKYRDTIVNDNTPLPDISDREFNTILTHIYRAKGNRITVILDCCHTANLNRSMLDERVRAIPSLPRISFDKMLHDADQNTRRFPDYHSILDEDWLPNMDSHVILAPCREYQLTMERREGSGFHGAFTQSLLHTLKSGCLGKYATYTDLIDVLPWSDYQTPVVAGKRKGTRLWYQD
ncbi:caspase domain-containing protein [Armillaria mellea]|nr:caspase domain-containing protein [Armillaria mellea]